MVELVELWRLNFLAIVLAIVVPSVYHRYPSYHKLSIVRPTIQTWILPHDLPMCKSLKSNDRLRQSSLMTLKSCGHRVSTVRSTTESHQAMIRILYEMGKQHLSEGFGPLYVNGEWANDLTTNSSMPFPSRSENHSAGETSGDIADQSTGVSSSFQVGDYGQASATNRRHKSHQEDDVIRFIYICFPSSNGRWLGELPIRTKEDRRTDRVLIKRLKEVYNSLRPYHERLRTLRDFSTIRLARVSAIIPLLYDADTDAC